MTNIIKTFKIGKSLDGISFYLEVSYNPKKKIVSISEDDIDGDSISMTLEIFKRIVIFIKEQEVRSDG